ncbi:MAG: MFS transporter [Acholeplasmatales bacterium]|nr:MFS transporter [Acholeplasmatales bacterium]
MESELIEKEKKLKLNYKNTMFIGLAFFSILMLWQVYNAYCPLFLSDLLNYDKESYVIGIFMATDNVIALILLPIFGRLSDKTHTRFGKRMPYIIVGMLLAALVFPFIPLFYTKGNLVGVILTMLLILCIMHMYRTPAVSLMPDVTPKPLRSKANGIINLVGYFGPIIAAVVKMLLDYKDHPYIPFFTVSICLVLAALVLFMTIKENELLEKMQPDLILGEELSQSLDKIEEDKPMSNRDKKNLIIILLSTFLWFMAFNALESFLSLYCKEVLGNERLSGSVTIVLTISSVLTFIPAGLFANKIGRKLSIVIGLIFLFIGFLGSALISPIVDVRKKLDFSYDPISATYYMENSQYHIELKDDSTYILETNVHKEGTYKIGKNYIELDDNDVYTYDSFNNTFIDYTDQTLDEFKSANKSIALARTVFMVLVACAGIGWALINVSSYPMVCELASQKNIGKISSYYYLASMLAQSVTPILVGLIMAFGTGYKGLFYYSSIVTIIAFIVFILYKENKQKVEILKKGFELFD